MNLRILSLAAVLALGILIILDHVGQAEGQKITYRAQEYTLVDERGQVRGSLQSSGANQVAPGYAVLFLWTDSLLAQGTVPPPGVTIIAHDDGTRVMAMHDGTSEQVKYGVRVNPDGRVEAEQVSIIASSASR